MKNTTQTQLLKALEKIAKLSDPNRECADNTDDLEFIYDIAKAAIKQATEDDQDYTYITRGDGRVVKVIVPANSWYK